MTAIDEMCRMLDERWVEYRVSATGYSLDIVPHMSAYANRSNTTIDVSMRGITPEQAIAAILGRGECHVDATIKWDWDRCEPYWEHELSCGHTVTTMEPVPPRFCPNCGRRVVGEWSI